MGQLDTGKHHHHCMCACDNVCQAMHHVVVYTKRQQQKLATALLCEAMLQYCKRILWMCCIILSPAITLLLVYGTGMLCAQKAQMQAASFLLICSWSHAPWVATSSVAACQAHGAQWLRYAHPSIFYAILECLVKVLTFHQVS